MYTYTTQRFHRPKFGIFRDIFFLFFNFKFYFGNNFSNFNFFDKFMTTEKIIEQFEERFNLAFPHKLAEVIDDFGSPVKQNIKSFLISAMRQVAMDR